MHPAYSVILFTTASGAGYGLLALLGLVGFLLVPVDGRLPLRKPLRFLSSPGRDLGARQT